MEEGGEGDGWQEESIPIGMEPLKLVVDFT